MPVLSESGCLGWALDGWTEATSHKLSLSASEGVNVKEMGGGNADFCEGLTPCRETLLTSWQGGENQGREVEGQPQPHVKCVTDIWTAPSLLLLFHSVHNLYLVPLTVSFNTLPYLKYKVCKYVCLMSSLLEMLLLISVRLIRNAKRRHEIRDNMSPS